MMNNDSKFMFDLLLSRLKQKSTENIEMVEKAYKFAFSKHKGQKRKSGEDYITHPLSVALTLENLGFDSEVICAGILHDVVEDCDVSVSEIEKTFSSNIAEIVSAVTAINETDLKLDEEDLYQDQNFEKFSLEEQTYKKLLFIGKKNRLAFFIKFADRLHNLQTIGCFDDYKKIEKVRETQRWILPIAKFLKTEYFSKNLENMCFIIENEKNIKNYLEIYERYLKLNKKIYQEINEELFRVFDRTFAKQKNMQSVQEIKFVKETEKVVYEAITKVIPIKRVSEVKQSHLNKIPTENIFIIINSNFENKKINQIILDYFEQNLIKKLKLINYFIDSEFNHDFFIVQDEFKNKYKLSAMTPKDYALFVNGSTDGVDLEIFDENITEQNQTNFISIRSRSGEIIKMPEGSTVLDFAFRVHNDIGFSAKYAIINDSPTRFPLYTCLHHGDKVSVICEKDQNGELLNQAKIRWLAYVKSEYAQRALIRFFERKQKA